MENGASKTRLGSHNGVWHTEHNSTMFGSYDGAWYTEYNGTKFMTVSQIFMEWGQFFVRQGNIWQTIPLYIYCMISLCVCSCTTKERMTHPIYTHHWIHSSLPAETSQNAAWNGLWLRVVSRKRWINTLAESSFVKHGLSWKRSLPKGFSQKKDHYISVSFTNLSSWVLGRTLSQPNGS